MQNKPAILLTATINPRGVPIARAAVEERLADYQKALRYWASAASRLNLVFCESSKGDLTSLKETCRQFLSPDGQVEWLSFNGSIQPPQRGIGYGEMQILEYALTHSKFLNNAPFIVKTTGRLYIQNIGNLIDRVKNHPNVDIWVDFRRNLRTTISYLFAAKPEFFTKYLIPQKESVDDCKKRCNFEHVLARTVHHALADGLEWRTLPISPKVIGTSASHNHRYNNGPMWWILREFYRMVKQKAFNI